MLIPNYKQVRKVHFCEKFKFTRLSST